MSESRTPSPFNPLQWHTPQSPSLLVRNLAQNLYYSIDAHYGLVWPDFLPKAVLGDLARDDAYPEPSAIPDNVFIRDNIKPAIEFLLPILHQLHAEKQPQGVLVHGRNSTANGGEQRDLSLTLAGQIREAQEKFHLNDPKATNIQIALGRHPKTMVDMIGRLSQILSFIDSSPSVEEDAEDKTNFSGECNSATRVGGFVAHSKQQSPKSKDKMPALGSPRFPITPISQSGKAKSNEFPGDETSGDESSSTSRHISPGSLDVSRLRQRSPMTPPTTPGRSPIPNHEKRAAAKRNHQVRLFTPPPDSDLPLLVETHPTSSSTEESQDSASPGDKSAAETSSPVRTPRTPSQDSVPKSSSSQVQSQMNQSGKSATEQARSRSTLRDPYKTPSRPSTSIQGHSNRLRRPIPRKPVPVQDLEEQAESDAGAGEAMASPVPSELPSIPGSQSTRWSWRNRPSSVRREETSATASSSSALQEATNRLPEPISGKQPTLSIRIPPTPPPSNTKINSRAEEQLTREIGCQSRGSSPESLHSTSSCTTSRSIGSPSISSRRGSASHHTAFQDQEIVFSTQYDDVDALPRRKSKKVKQVWKGKNGVWSPIHPEVREGSGSRYYRGLNTCCCQAHRCPCRAAASRDTRSSSFNKNGLYYVPQADMESNNNGFMKSSGLAFEGQEYERIMVVVVDIRKSRSSHTV